MSSSEIAEEFAARLRWQRLARNLSQKELAARAGISLKTVTNFERSGKDSLDNFLRIVDGLGFSDSMSNLCEARPKTIKEMELAEQKRKRASKKNGKVR